MSDIIRLLPDSVANQIAAGEVIQRPASVIKELVENSVDAGATDIKIFIKDAGRTLIQVVDNGKGMTPTDTRMAFERHATSKIREASDLFALHSMGFRGEALPSVCAISQVEIKSKPKGAAIGTRLLINGGKVESQEPVACEEGTNIMVKNLFYNVPARRKFLKTDSVELSNIMREFERMALVNNNIRMSIDTGFRTLDLRNASFKQRIADIWKNALDLHLVPVEVDTALVKISGFLSRPEYARRRNPLQYLIVNDRNMRHPYFHKTILSCYESLIAADTQPCYFLKFEVDPSSIDVNIHPTKNEIKFEYEQDIRPILQAAVKAALGKSGSLPSIDFNTDIVPVSPLSPGETPVKPGLDIPDDYSPFESKSKIPGQYDSYTYNYKGRDKVEKNWDSLYSDFMKGARGSDDSIEKEKSEESLLPEFSSIGPQESLCIQHSGKYIVTSSREGLMIIDQRRAHVRILYEDFISRLSKGEQPSQGLMFPDTIELDPSMQESLAEVMPELLKAGFRIEYVEDNKWRLNGVPSIMGDIDPKDMIMRLLDAVVDSGDNYGKDSRESNPLIRKLALIMARASAINYGRKLSIDEMENIIGRLFSIEDSMYTPNGKRVYYLLPESSIISLFR